MEEARGIVIVGGGICGLATALALHRKGIRSLVLERSDSLRASGAAIGMWANAWRALDQLQVGDELREKAVVLTEMVTRLGDQMFSKSPAHVTPIRSEFRGLVRKDLIEALASKLPAGTIRFGYIVDEITVDPATSSPVLHLRDGSTINAKILIGCDGANSTVARFLGLKDATPLPMWIIRGFTTYRDGHPFGRSMWRTGAKTTFLGRIPITDNLVHFFFPIPIADIDAKTKDDPKLMKQLAIEKARGFSPDVFEMVEQCDMESLSLTHIRHRIPCHLDKGKCQRGTVTVAGDAMHVLSPFNGQGGALAMEDAIVLARKISAAMANGEQQDGLEEKIAAAQREYLKERWPRVMQLSTMAYVAVSALTSPPFMKLFYFAILKLFFGGPDNLSHTEYDCGQL